MNSRVTQHTNWLEDAQRVLQDQWGYDSFRAGQAEAVSAVLNDQDVLLVLPTGGGKSICYQVPAIVQNGCALVISPLIALMQDQVAALDRAGVKATFINSSLRYREVEQRLINAEHGMYDLLYLAPERLSNEMFKSRMERLDINLLAVDEAHCISEWGHHFRPAYREIADSIEVMGNPPVMAVTATATPEVRRDIVKQLRLSDPERIIKGFDRPNICWSVFTEVNKKQKLQEILEKIDGPGIVYVATRRSAERWANWLRKQEIEAAAYHGGLATEQRDSIQRAWLEGESRAVVATNAFGMGIDKANVRFVIHLEIPASLEAYYQEAGRAGRDGANAHAILLYQRPDSETQEYLIESGHPDREEAARVYEAICNLAQIPLQDQPEDPIEVDAEAVRRLTDLSTPKIKQAIDLLERQGFWEMMPQRSTVGHLRFTQDVEDIREQADRLQNRATAEFLRQLLRTIHADAYSGWWPVHLPSIARKMEFPVKRLIKGLEYFAKRDILKWMGPGQAIRLTLQQPRTRRPRIDDEAVQMARKQAEKRLGYLESYTQTGACRRKYLLNYFGESAPEKCGYCDNCLGRHDEIAITSNDSAAMYALLWAIRYDSRRDAWNLQASSRHVSAYLDWLIQEGYVLQRAEVDACYELTDRGEKLAERLS